MGSFQLDTKGLGKIWTIVLVLIVAVMSLMAGMMLGQAYLLDWESGDSLGVTVTKKATATPTTATATATVTDETADWKTYENSNLGFSFKYPDTWSTVKLTKENNIGDLSGHMYATWTSKGPGNYDTDKVFEITLYSSDYEKYEWDLLNKKQVNVNWSKAEFASNMGLTEENVLFVKKLDSKSMLVADYVAPECSPGMRLQVLTPFSASYPNFQISIAGKFYEDQIIKDYEKAQLAAGKDTCDELAQYKQVATKVENGTYSEKMKEYIETARLIASTLRVK